MAMPVATALKDRRIQQTAEAPTALQQQQQQANHDRWSPCLRVNFRKLHVAFRRGSGESQNCAFPVLPRGLLHLKQHDRSSSSTTTTSLVCQEEPRRPHIVRLLVQDLRVGPVITFPKYVRVAELLSGEDTRSYSALQEAPYTRYRSSSFTGPEDAVERRKSTVICHVKRGDAKPAAQLSMAAPGETHEAVDSSTCTAAAAAAAHLFPSGGCVHAAQQLLLLLGQ